MEGNFDYRILIEIIGMLAMLGVQTWLLLRWVIERIDKLKDDTVRRDDFQRYCDANDRAMTGLRDDIKRVQESFTNGINQLGQQINARLDNLILSFTNNNKKD